MIKRLISLALVVVLLLSLCVSAMAVRTESAEITYRAIKISLNGEIISPCDAEGKGVEPFIMNASGTTYLPLRAVAQALGLDVKWDGATSTVTLAGGGAVKTGDEAPLATRLSKTVDITYRDIKVILDGQQLELVNAAGAAVEPFIMDGTTYLPLRVIGEALGLRVGWDAATSTASLTEPTGAEAELQRAAELGLVSSTADAASVSFKDYFAMLDSLVKKLAPEKAAAFAALYPAAAKSGEAMTRYDAMVALYSLAECLGGAFPEVGWDWLALHDQIGEKCWDEIRWNPLYGERGWEQEGFEGFSYDAASYFYALGRKSLYSSERLFDYSEAENSMRCDDNITRREAMLSIVRFHDSDRSVFPVIERPSTAADRAYLASVGAKIEAIRSTETAVTYTGTAYYVSESGSDSNSGRSPAQAWASLERVNSADLRPGDAVFFERGGIFRGHLWAREGVTYSAYGQGEKPRLYASPESGVGAEKWSLYYDEGGVKIWKFHSLMQDCGGIVFNDGESWASRVFSYWDGKKAVSVEDKSLAFDMIAELEYDLQFYCGYPEDIASRAIPFSAFDAELHGELYLRCDKGNPGELYEEIEFQCPADPVGYAGIIQGADSDNFTVDNLCVMYSNTMAIACGTGSGITIQNCEAGFVGGGSHVIGYYAEDACVPASGEGIRLDGYNNKAVNNYVHDCFDGGIITEPDLSYELDGGEIPDWLLDVKWGEVSIEDNVIERCISGVLIGVHVEDSVIPYVESLSIKDNDILWSGYGWSSDPHYNFTWNSEDYNGNAITFWDADHIHGPFTVENNRLYAAKASLIRYFYSEENMPVFSGNTYAQNPNGYVIRGIDTAMAYSDAGVIAGCREHLGDADAKVIK